MFRRLAETFTTTYDPSKWHYLTLTYDTINSLAAAYYDGALSQSMSNNQWPSVLNDVKIGIGYDATRGWIGAIDEVRMSSSLRSADWIATEYNNQNSPSTFYTVFGETAAVSVTPLTALLYAGQSQQLVGTVAGDCSNPGVTWNINPAGLGTISPTGLYTAPASISSFQNVTVTAMDANNSALSASATFSLMPPVNVSVVPNLVTLFAGDQQQFSAVIGNATSPGTSARQALAPLTTPACTPRRRPSHPRKASPSRRSAPPTPANRLPPP